MKPGTFVFGLVLHLKVVLLHREKVNASASKNHVMIPLVSWRSLANRAFPGFRSDKKCEKNGYWQLSSIRAYTPSPSRFAGV